MYPINAVFIKCSSVFRRTRIWICLMARWRVTSWRSQGLGDHIAGSLLHEFKFIHEQAEAITERLPEEDKVEYLYELLFNRRAEEKELEFTESYFAKDNSRQRWVGYVRSMLSSNEFLFVD